MDTAAVARQLAEQHPAAMLPCPTCGVSLKAENVDRHLAKVHAGAAVEPATVLRGKGWLRIVDCTLELAPDAIVLRHWLRVARRAVALPCKVEVGAMYAVRPEAAMATYADDFNVPHETVRTGSYVRLVGNRAITIGCKQDTLFASHWATETWTRGPRRRMCDVHVDRATLVAIEYALVARGVLRPAAAGVTR